LSAAIRAVGYDGIVTYDKGGTREIVDLRGVPTPQQPEGAPSPVQGPQQPAQGPPSPGRVPVGGPLSEAQQEGVRTFLRSNQARGRIVDAPEEDADAVDFLAERGTPVVYVQPEEGTEMSRPAMYDRSTGTVLLDASQPAALRRRALLYHELGHHLKKVSGEGWSTLQQALLEADPEGMRFVLEEYQAARRELGLGPLEGEIAGEEQVSAYLEDIAGWLELARTDPARLHQVLQSDPGLFEKIIEAIRSALRRIGVPMPASLREQLDTRVTGALDRARLNRVITATMDAFDLLIAHRAPEGPALEARAAEPVAPAAPAAAAPEEGRFALAPPTESREFKRWFGESKVVDEAGEPLAVHHGTREPFSKFEAPAEESRSSVAWLRSRLGTGLHFFSSKPSVASAYAVEGDDKAYTPEFRSGAAVMRVYLSLQNPLEINAQGQPWHDVVDEIGDGIERFVSLRHKRMRAVIQATGKFADEFEEVDWGAFSERYPALAKRLHKWGVTPLQEREGEQSLSHDGVIIRSVMDGPDAESMRDITDVYIAFTPSQIKSATGLDPARVTEPGDIRGFSEAERAEGEVRPDLEGQVGRPGQPRRVDPDAAEQAREDWEEGRFALAPPTESREFKRWFGESKVVDEAGEPLVVYHGTRGNFGPGATRHTSRYPDVLDAGDGLHLGSAEVAGMFAPPKEGLVQGAGPRVYPVYASVENPVRLRDYGGWLLHTNLPTREVEDSLYKNLLAEAGRRGLHGALPQDLDRYDPLSSWVEYLGSDGVVYLNRYEIPVRAGSSNYVPVMTEVSKRVGIDRVRSEIGWGPSRGETASIEKWLREVSDERFLEVFPTAQDAWIVFTPEQVKSATGNRGTFDPESDDLRFATRSAIDRPRLSGKPITPGALAPRLPAVQGEPEEPPVTSPPPPPPGASAEEWAAAAEEATSIKNEVVDRELALLGMPEAEHAEGITFEEINEAAAQRMREDPYAGERLMRELKERERPVTAEEVALLTRERNRLRLQRQAVDDAIIQSYERGDQDRVEAQKAAARRLDREFQAASDIVTRVGTLNAQALAARRLEMREDYSLANMIRHKRAANDGAPLTEEQEKALRSLSRRMQKALQLFDQYSERRLRELAGELAEQVPEAPAKRRRPPVQAFLSDRAAEARARLKAKAPAPEKADPEERFALDPKDDVVDHVIIGAEYVSKGSDNFSDWSRAMLTEFGEGVRPRLRDIYDQSVEMVRQVPRLKAYKTRQKKAAEELRTKIAQGDFTRRKPSKLILDEEGVNLKAEVEELRREFRQGVEMDRFRNMTGLDRAVYWSLEALNLPRALMTGWDLSAGLRQGGFFSLAHPIKFTTEWAPKMIRAFASEKMAMRVDVELRNRALAQLGEASGLELTRHGDDVGVHEEAIRSRLSDKFPGMKGSNRAYITMLNLQRAWAFDRLVNAVQPTEKAQLQAIAEFVNAATGRGGGKSKAGRLLSAASNLGVFWSPRLVYSRFQLAVTKPADIAVGMVRGGEARATQRAIAAEYARFLGGLAAVYAMARLLGADVEDDWRSSDFGKIRFGRTRIDPMTGLSQVTVLMGRMVTGETKSTRTGKVRPIRGEDVPYGASTAAGVVGRFLRSKLSPMVALGMDVAAGETMVGEPVSLTTVEGLGNIAAQRFVPLSFQDIYEAMRDQGLSRGAALGVLSLFGWGIQVHWD
jgi:hypothetical protein